MEMLTIDTAKKTGSNDAQILVKYSHLTDAEQV